ncbi:hypothetical protein MHYP_G00190510 [Metynnis hypsauchen]
MFRQKYTGRFTHTEAGAACIEADSTCIEADSTRIEAYSTRIEAYSTRIEAGSILRVWSVTYAPSQRREARAQSSVWKPRKPSKRIFV